MKKLLVVLCVLMCLSGCASTEYVESDVYYEIYVGSFNDSDGDSIGDLNGITEKLDYLKDLGIGGIWLMPISESDTYHKYDVIDYMSIDEDYGTIEDFEKLCSEAEKKNVDIIIDLVLNHSSSKHPWFIEAKTNFLNNDCDKEDSKCDYYHFSDEYSDGYTKIDDNHYYESVFWSEMPDLNLDNPEIREEIMTIVDFWIDKGVDGFRLDAVYHYYGGNVTDNNEFTKWFQDYVESKDEDAHIVGEVWADESTLLRSYESKIDSLFNFSLAGKDGRIVSAINKQNGKLLSDYVVQHSTDLENTSADSIDAVFLSNHDQARAGGFLIGDERKKLAASLYLLMPGVPFVYYGEEIGMKGSGIDENKRMAMLWGEGNDCNSPAAADYTKQIDSSVKEQESDEESLLNFYKEVIAVRNKYPLFTDADVESFETDNSSLYALTYLGEDNITVITNMSDSEVELVLDGEYALDSIIDVVGAPTLEGSTLKLPAYSTAIIK